MIPHTVPAIWPEASPGKLAAEIIRGITERVRGDDSRTTPGRGVQGGAAGIALLGLPDDTGVRLNRGRPGAASGPAAFRAALARFGTLYDLAAGRDLDVPIVDAGDLVPALGDDEDALLETHDRATQAVRAIHALDLVPVCVGGGHDLTLATVRALALHTDASLLGGINVDAHLDVREEVGSGMPFRSLIADGYVDAGRFVAFGAGRFAHAPEHVRWLTGEGGRIVSMDEVERDATSATDEAFARAGRGGRPLFVTLDLDAIDGAYAPGVSAVNPMGLDVGTVAGVAERAGRNPDVLHFDLMELSPPHDADGRTARLAAYLFLRFVAGFQARMA